MLRSGAEPDAAVAEGDRTPLMAAVEADSAVMVYIGSGVRILFVDGVVVLCVVLDRSVGRERC